MSDFLLSLQDVSLAFGGPPVLDKVSLSISKGLRAALTGRNGEGKSTLMKVIAGAIEPDGGTIVRAPNLRTIYVSQDVPHAGQRWQRRAGCLVHVEAAVHFHRDAGDSTVPAVAGKGHERAGKRRVDRDAESFRSEEIHACGNERPGMPPGVLRPFPAWLPGAFSLHSQGLHGAWRRFRGEGMSLQPMPHSASETAQSARDAVATAASPPRCHRKDARADPAAAHRKTLTT